MRLAPLTGLVGSQLDFSGSHDSARANVGAPLLAAPIDGVDTGTNVPNWGVCELVYVRYASATVIDPGRLVHVDKNFTILDMPNTANTGRPVYVTLSRFTAGDVTTQYGWVLRSGIAPVQYSVAATAGAVYFAAAGQATPTLTAGKQLLNATCLIAAASAFTRSGTTTNGSTKVTIPRTNGIFYGVTVSGTGVPASSEVTEIGTDFFVMSEAATATGTVTLTFTPTGFGICEVNRAFVQGNIT